VQPAAADSALFFRTAEARPDGGACESVKSIATKSADRKRVTGTIQIDEAGVVSERACYMAVAFRAAEFGPHRSGAPAAGGARPG
jgi:hypothetical protein